MSTQQQQDRRARRAHWQGRTPEEIIRDTPDPELRLYARRGAPMAIAEVARREQYFQLPPNWRSDLEREIMVEAMVPDWRIE